MEWKSVLRETNLITEVKIIIAAMRKIGDRWGDLIEYIGSLLVEDFMDPKSYAMLLFDDETFSRSRLYFWIIGCLSEFDVSIEDNIKQWKLFRQARIDPEVEKFHEEVEFGFVINNSPEGVTELRDLSLRGEEARQVLEDLQSQFRAKLATVQTLRDGVSFKQPIYAVLRKCWAYTIIVQLFNASALIESRSSTRLGQNVKLLTYVSIVYLPLAFCAVSI